MDCDLNAPLLAGLESGADRKLFRCLSRGWIKSRIRLLIFIGSAAGQLVILASAPRTNWRHTPFSSFASGVRPSKEWPCAEGWSGCIAFAVVEIRRENGKINFYQISVASHLIAGQRIAAWIHYESRRDSVSPRPEFGDALRTPESVRGC
jgi:hypothetical protein